MTIALPPMLALAIALLPLTAAAQDAMAPVITFATHLWSADPAAPAFSRSVVLEGDMLTTARVDGVTESSSGRPATPAETALIAAALDAQIATLGGSTSAPMLDPPFLLLEWSRTETMGYVNVQQAYAPADLPAPVAALMTAVFGADGLLP